MPDHSVDLQEAVYLALSNDAALTALLGSGNRIYDHVPAGAALPYVVIGETTAADISGALVDMQEHTLTMHAWSERPTSLEVKQIVAAVRAVLHDARLTLNSGRCPNIRCEYHETMRDPDGISHHGVMRFRAVTQD